MRIAKRLRAETTMRLAWERTGGSHTLLHYVFPGCAGQLDTDLHAPIFNRRAIHGNVIVVSCRRRSAIFTFFGSPLRRAANSPSCHPRSVCTMLSACASSASLSAEEVAEFPVSPIEARSISAQPPFHPGYRIGLRRLPPPGESGWP